MTPQEADDCMTQFQPYITVEEEERIDAAFDHYVFYETYGRRNFRECVCTHLDCSSGGFFEAYKEDEPEFFEGHHGDKIECPNCGRGVTLISLGKMRSFATLTQTKRVAICRASVDGTLLVTSGWAQKEYSWNDLRPVIDFTEKQRNAFRPGKRMQWRVLQDWCGWRYVTKHWCKSDFVTEPFAPWMYTSDGSYHLITPEKIEESQLRYCQLRAWFDADCKGDVYDTEFPIRQVVKYLSRYTEHPTMEMAVKIGLTAAVNDLVISGLKNHRLLNWNARTIHEFLRLTKPEAKAFVKREYTFRILQEYRNCKEQGTVKSLDEMEDLIQAAGGVEYVGRLAACARKAGVSLKKACNYVNGNQDVKRISTAMTLWNDYLDMAMKLQYDFSRLDVVMPKDLRQRHDAAAETIQIQTKEEEFQKYKARYENLRKLYEFEYEGICVRIPQSAEAIVAEGKALCHCVGGYAARHIKGVLDILFLRSSDDLDTPLITIEMTARKHPTDKVILHQIHGYKNDMGNPNKQEDVYADFLDAWYDWQRHGSPRDRKGKPIITIDNKEKTA